MLQPGCTFEEATHAYRRDGLPIPSVTRILDHGGLVNFEMVRQDVLERKATIGTLVHLATKFYDQGDLDWNSLDRYTRGRVEAWALFRKETGFTPRIIEEQYIANVQGMSFGLTVDREGLLRGTSTIIEIKTASAPSEWWGLQTAGYAMAVPDPEEKLLTPITCFMKRRRMAIMLLEDGSYKKIEHTENDDWQVFLWALGLTHWKLKKGKAFRKIEE